MRAALQDQLGQQREEDRLWIRWIQGLSDPDA